MTASCEYIFRPLFWKSDWNAVLSGYKKTSKNDGNNFKNDSLHFLRMRDLKYNFEFGENSLKDFTKISKDHKDIKDNNLGVAMDVFKRVGSSYFMKLCTSYESRKNR